MPVEQRPFGADAPANAAGNAAANVDHVPFLRRAVNGEHGALPRAGGAAVASFSDKIWHESSLL
ncbi:hypothetical protein SDC9_162249 [bioreactor metagenome]|uniref:Uncharacterized protein n=1 Tax=bioreactor metagenome TaxID=1076179 RepID=A0A645FLV4_9ZZZZ